MKFDLKPVEMSIYPSESDINFSRKKNSYSQSGSSLDIQMAARLESVLKFIDSIEFSRLRTNMNQIIFIVFSLTFEGSVVGVVDGG